MPHCNPLTNFQLHASSPAAAQPCRQLFSPSRSPAAALCWPPPVLSSHPRCSYDLELLDFEAADEGKERAMMTFEERLEAAERRRADGNAAFSAGQHAQALGKYRCAAGWRAWPAGWLAGCEEA